MQSRSDRVADAAIKAPTARILVIGDHPKVRKAIRQALGESHRLEFASTPEHALELIAVGSFEVAICSIDDIGGTGLSLALEIAQDHPDTAAVVLATGGDDREAARDAFASGVYAYLVEPFWPGQLLITIMGALRRRELEIVARKARRTLETRRQGIIDMVPIAIYAKDTDGLYIVANKKADQLAGLKAGELLGQTDAAFLSPDEMELGASSDRRVFEERTAHEREDSVEIAGVKQTFKTVRFPLFGDDGEVTAVGGVSLDVTSELKAIDDLRLSRQETIEGLAKAIDLHDASTGGHVNRMAAIAEILAAGLDLDPELVQLLRAAAPMHDVGKIGISPDLLRKPGLLTPEERTEMELHTAIGHRIFAGFESDLSRMAAMIALTHHERYDGSGYPNGLAGEEIPIEGRVTAVADVFDALLSDRSYRPAMSVEEAVAVIRSGSGEQFDPRVVDQLLEHLDEALSVREG